MSGPRVCLLTGGFGGARMAPGLHTVLGAGRLQIVANPGDDLTYAGGEVWPDFDSVLYALAGVFDEEQGWGIAGDAYPANGWFRIGERDLELSRRRAAWLRAGASHGDVARRARALLGVGTALWPASGERCRTSIVTESGTHGFQEYLVRMRASEPPLEVLRRPERPGACPEAVAAIVDADLVVLGASNPITSLLPIVGVREVGRALERARRVVGVSPVVRAVPPALPPEQGRYRVREMFLARIGVEHSAQAVRRLWEGVAEGFVMDARDAGEGEAMPDVLRTDLLPPPGAPRAALAAEVVEFGMGLEPRHERRDVDQFLRRVTPATATPVR